MVGLVREPHNQYDHNAVMVTNIYGNQVGHIKKELAAAMAYIMDNNMAKVEGWVPDWDITMNAISVAHLHKIQVICSIKLYASRIKHY